MKRILTAILLIATMAMTLALTACGGEAVANGKDGKDGVGIIKAEIINEELWLTYSNDPENPVNVGKIYAEKVDEDSLLPESAQILDYYPLPDGTYGVKSGKAAYMEEIVVPEKFNGRVVTRILDKGFASCGAKKITLPGAISEIGNDAFSGSLALEEITLPNSLISIGTSAFAGCTALKSITVPDGVTSIGANAFSGCSALESAIFPESITAVSTGMFSNCTSLKSVKLSDRVKEIGASAFNACTSLSEFDLPASLNNIGNSAFRNCKALTKITIPEGVANVGEYVFMDCSLLATVNMPKSLRKLSPRSFQNCKALITVNFGGTMAEWSSVSKDISWDSGSGRYKVVCKDGTVGEDNALSGN